MARETNAELVARHKRVSQIYDEASKTLARAKTGRDKKARQAGCVNFTLLQIESEMRDRGLLK